MRTVAAGSTLVAAASAGAQSDARDSLPTHAGTYALEGGVGVNSTSFGALRFLSPRSALGATLTAGYSHQAGNGNSYDYGSTGLTLGYRRYGRLRDRVAGFGTVGLTGAYSHQRQTQVSGYGSLYSTTSANVGAFGELGATYLVARRLTVNASAQASVVRLFSRVSNQQAVSGSVVTSTTYQNGFNAALGAVRFGLTLFL